MNLRIFLAATLALVITNVTVNAQTASSPNEGSNLTRDPATGADTLSWCGRTGRTYFLQQSENLLNWTYLPVIELGADQPIGWGFVSNADKSFLRLKFSDIPSDNPFTADSDGDGVNNWDELMQGTDPLAAVDTEPNGLADDWEIHFFGHTGVDPNALAARGGGLTNLQAFQQHLDPNDFFGGRMPTLGIVSGDFQTAPPDSLLPVALVVSVADANGLPLANAPVTFTVGAGGGQLKAFSSASFGTTLTLYTDEIGHAKAYFKLPNTQNQVCTITSVAGNSNHQALITFTATSGGISAPPAVSPFAPTNFVAQSASRKGVFGDLEAR